ncbi:MAG: Tagatose-6-phosphate kinase [Candidatus Hydrogenedentes bacterium ADurb.Bin101]|nr:MAG: Tagatose-6-phosphate kinase [Candidatus Hydrogenedentes bacterium ADurb.Bin101]HOC68999.1 1-phosphofructokinase family hexose kinase [Candidatus Hydrogenedentota bacterium]
MILTVTPNPCVDKTLFTGPIELGAKIRAQRCACIAGGKGCNVSRAVKAMGGDTVAMVMVAGPTGRHVVDMLEKRDGVPTVPVWVDGLTRTITTVLEEPPHRQTAFFEPGPLTTGAERRRFTDLFREAITQAELVTLNGSAPDPALDTLYRDLLDIAHAGKVPVILDAYGMIFANALQSRPFMVKPNVEELELLFASRLDTREKQWQAVDRLREGGVERVVLSLGEEGALVASKEGCFHVVPPKIDEVNPVGSGDALVAGFALGLTRGKDLVETARMGIAMGTANAMTWDIGSFTRAQVEALKPAVRLVPRTG